MAIAGFKAREFSTARELALFVTTNDDVETVFATTFNTASGKYSIFFADMPGVADVYLRTVSESVSPSVAEKVTQRMVGSNKVTESASATATQTSGAKKLATETESATLTELSDRSDP